MHTKIDTKIKSRLVANNQLCISKGEGDGCNDKVGVEVESGVGADL